MTLSEKKLYVKLVKHTRLYKILNLTQSQLDVSPSSMKCPMEGIFIHSFMLTFFL